jgi:quercetin dioxygenase-like cupin family protein
MQSTHIVYKGMYGALDVLGPTIEFLTPPDDRDAGYCVMRGTIPPGVSVPLHSHADFESFFRISGAVQVLAQRNDGFEWLDVKKGDFVHIPGNAKHAFRNTSNEPVVQLISTTPALGRFFQEIGRPIVAGVPTRAPTPDELQQFASIAASYHYWLGSPAENAAVGISMF